MPIPGSSGSISVTCMFDYSLSNNGPVTIQSGTSGTVTITATLTSGTAQPVALSCVTIPAPPQRFTCTSFNPTSVSPTGSSVLTISILPGTSAGDITVQVTGTPLGATTTPTTVTVHVTTPPPPPFDYTLSNDGPVIIQAGSSGTVTIRATLTAGTAESVALSCVTPLPSGVTCSMFSPTSVTPTGSSTLTISVASSTAAGPVSVQVTGTPLGATTTPTTVSVTITSPPPPPFDYALANNGPATIQAGSSGTVTITATLTAGTAMPVTLSCVSSSLPAGITC